MIKSGRSQVSESKEFIINGYRLNQIGIPCPYCGSTQTMISGNERSNRMELECLNPKDGVKHPSLVIDVRDLPKFNGSPKFKSSTKSDKFYHLTTSDKVQSILKNGLRTSFSGSVEREVNAGKNKIYLTDDISFIVQGDIEFQVSDLVALEIDRKGIKSKLIEDMEFDTDAYGDPHAWYIKSDIDPKFIKYAGKVKFTGTPGRVESVRLIK